MGECMNAGARSAIRALSRPGTGHRGASRDCRGHDQGGERPDRAPVTASLAATRRQPIARVRLTIPNEFNEAPPATLEAMGMTCRRINSTKPAINIMCSASTVRIALPRAAVCAA